MDGPVGQIVHRALAVDGAAQRVEHAAQSALAHRGIQAVAGGGNFHPLAQTLAGRKHDAAHRRFIDMLRHLHGALSALCGHSQRFLQGRQLAPGEFDIHHGARYSNNSSLYHTIASFFCYNPLSLTSFASSPKGGANTSARQPSANLQGLASKPALPLPLGEVALRQQ